MTDAKLAALVADVEALRATVNSLLDRVVVLEGDGRLGPRKETAEDLVARRARMDAFIDRIRVENRPAPPVDRTAVTTTSGEPPEVVRAAQTNETGQHAAYIVLSASERARGFVRPVRRTYRHVGLAGPDPANVAKGGCGTTTTMGDALAETYARDPTFYGLTFCCGCNAHFPVAEFVWDRSTDRVGS